MTLMAIGFCVLIGAALATFGWLAFMWHVGKRTERVSAMKRAILDKMEAPPVDDSRASILADMERHIKNDRRVGEGS